jgi:uncharacterized membrane protein
MDESQGSIESALAGDFSLSIGEILGEAWEAIDGYKMPLLLAFSLLFLIMIGLGIVQVLLVGSGAEVSDFSLIGLVITLVSYGFIGVYAAGSIVMSARASMGETVSATDAFMHLPLFLKAMGTYLMMTVLIGLGFLLLILPGIYLYVAYFYALPLALDKGLSPWEALETSRKTVTHQWFTLFGLHVVVWGLNVIGFFTLGIATIWLLPLSMVAYGIVYRKLFGVETVTRTA